MIRYPFLMIPVLAAAAACDARTDDNYLGEALFSLTGKVQSDVATVPEGTKLYLAWYGRDKPSISSELAIQPTFPAQFQLDMFEPPDVFNDPNDPQAPQTDSSNGRIIAAPPGTMLDEYLDWRDEPGLVGIDPRHYLRYQRMEANEYEAAFYHSPIPLGFTMIRVQCITPAHKALIHTCLENYPKPRDWDTAIAAMTDCGVLDENYPWLSPEPEGLDVQLSVELMADPTTWQPDPSECI